MIEGERRKEEGGSQGLSYADTSGRKGREECRWDYLKCIMYIPGPMQRGASSLQVPSL